MDRERQRDRERERGRMKETEKEKKININFRCHRTYGTQKSDSKTNYIYTYIMKEIILVWPLCGRKQRIKWGGCNFSKTIFRKWLFYAKIQIKLQLNLYKAIIQLCGLLIANNTKWANYTILVPSFEGKTGLFETNSILYHGNVICIKIT